MPEMRGGSMRGSTLVLCPKCGVAWHVIRQMLASAEVEERILAQTIIINCGECKKEFTKGGKVNASSRISG